MSRRYQCEVTLTVDGDETDLTVRACVEYERGYGGSWGGVVDGDIEARIGGAWVPLDSLALDDGDDERADEALCEEAMNDDSEPAHVPGYPS